MPKPPTPYTGRWPRIRKEVLARDGYLCKVQLPGCTVRADQVDHIIEIQKGGAWWDKTNLRAACGTCNRKRNKGGVSFRWMAGATYITLVLGPPGADLLGYVRAHASPSDLIADQAEIEQSVGMAGAERAWSALVDQLRRADVRVARAWITSHHPTAEADLPHHRVVVVQGRQGQAWLHDRKATHMTAEPSRDW